MTPDIMTSRGMKLRRMALSEMTLTIITLIRKAVEWHSIK
jgi:hypothetical protein